METVKKSLKKNYKFRYNTVLNRVEFKTKKEEEYKLLQDYQFNSLYIELLDKNTRISKGNFKSLLESKFSPEYDPFQEYFCSLPTWDGVTDYITILSNTIKTQNDEDFKWAFKKWFVAMVASLMHPNEINHTVLILSSKQQGLGKSRWISRLVPDSLSNYYSSGNINPRDKDSMIQLSENMLINMDELANFESKHIDELKEIITRPSSRVRKAYGHFAENYVRRASFIGTTNHKNILSDTTGNRRFLTFECNSIDYEHQIDVKMAYSQATSLLKSGFRHYFDEDDILRIEKNNEIFIQHSDETELIHRYFILPSQIYNSNFLYLTATEIIEYINEKSKGIKHYNLKAITIGKELNAIGFKKKKVKGIYKYALQIKK